MSALNVNEQSNSSNRNIFTTPCCRS
ncbi:multicatalytic endopeptidase, partial [Trichinella spiralis]